MCSYYVPPYLDSPEIQLLWSWPLQSRLHLSCAATAYDVTSCHVTGLPCDVAMIDPIESRPQTYDCDADDTKLIKFAKQATTTARRTSCIVTSRTTSRDLHRYIVHVCCQQTKITGWTTSTSTILGCFGIQKTTWLDKDRLVRHS